MIREPEFAKRMLACRERLAMRQGECARLAGVSRQHYNNWEIGIAKPKGERMAKLAEMLQCDAVWLQHGESSELEQRIGSVMQMMRVIIRDLDHIHKALASR